MTQPLETFVRNCHMKLRPGDEAIFELREGVVYARLDGYAIIPREDYDRLEAIAKRDDLPHGEG